MDKKGIVYIAKMGVSGLVKIGSSDGGPDGGADAIDYYLKCQTGHRVGLLYVSPATERFQDIKAELHRKFRIHNTYGEWFDISFSSARAALDETVGREGQKGAKEVNALALYVEGKRLFVIRSAPLKSEDGIDEFLSRVRHELMLGLDGQEEAREGA